MMLLGLCTSAFHHHLFIGLTRVRNITNFLVIPYLAEWPAEAQDSEMAQLTQH